MSIYIAHRRIRRQAGGPAVKPPLMRSLPWPELPANQATANSLHTQAWAATWPLAGNASQQ